MFVAPHSRFETQLGFSETPPAFRRNREYLHRRAIGLPKTVAVALRKNLPSRRAERPVQAEILGPFLLDATNASVVRCSCRARSRYVTAGVANPPPSPWLQAHQGWVLGSLDFVARLRALVRGAPPRELRRESRLIRGVELRTVSEIVCRGYQLNSAELSRRGSRHEARAALAHLAREHTEATYTELARLLGLSRADSVPNLTRRFARWLARREDVRARLEELEKELLSSAPPPHEKTKNLV
jgi:hypothetical protein